MKKLLFLLSAASFLIACNNNGRQKTEAAKNSDYVSQNLKGNVKSYEQTSTTIDSTGASKPDSTSSITTFDEKGYQTSYVTKDIDGKIKEDQTITHYDGGQTKEVISKNADGKQTNKWEISIDNNGKYTEAKVYDSTGKLSGTWKDLTENEYGQVTKGTQYKEDGTVRSSFENKYDGPNYVGGSGKDSTGKETYNGTVKLNDKGDPIEESSTTVTNGESKNETHTFQYDSYDEKGNWTQRTRLNEKGKPTKIIKRTFIYY